MYSLIHFLNIGKFLWGMFSIIPAEIGISIKILIIILIIVPIIFISLKTSQIYKNDFFKKFILLLFFIYFEFSCDDFG